VDRVRSERLVREVQVEEEFAAVDVHASHEQHMRCQPKRLQFLQLEPRDDGEEIVAAVALAVHVVDEYDVHPRLFLLKLL
jgi:hypothetical protein